MHTACESRALNQDLSILLNSHVLKHGMLLTLVLPFSWFIVGQLFASVALYRLKITDPLNYKTPIYTQVC